MKSTSDIDISIKEYNKLRIITNIIEEIQISSKTKKELKEYLQYLNSIISIKYNQSTLNDDDQILFLSKREMNLPSKEEIFSTNTHRQYIKINLVSLIEDKIRETYKKKLDLYEKIKDNGSNICNNRTESDDLIRENYSIYCMINRLKELVEQVIHVHQQYIIDDNTSIYNILYKEKEFLCKLSSTIYEKLLYDKINDNELNKIKKDVEKEEIEVKKLEESVKYYSDQISEYDNLINNDEEYSNLIKEYRKYCNLINAINK